MATDVLTLTAVARALGTPQHRLIHLCEKGVVVPDFGGSQGRGTSRRFSRRNLLEFAIALRVRDHNLPVEVAGGILRVLRQFEKAVAATLPGFRLPDSLLGASAPDFRVIVSDGRRLFFALGMPGSPPKVFGGIELSQAEPTTKTRLRLRELTAVENGTFGDPEGSRHTRFEVSITRIAQDFPSLPVSD